MFKKLLLLTGLTILFIACEDINDPGTKTFSTSGVFILNEGNFGSGNGDISFFSVDSEEVVNNLSLRANAFSAGDVVQDMLIHDTLAIVVVNYSNKIRVFKLNTFEWVKDIAIDQPRFIVKISDSLAYVSSWSGEIRILNFSTLELNGTITVGQGPEGMAIVGNNVYVAVSPGNDYVNNTNTVKVIRTSDHTVIKTIRVGWNPLKIAYSEALNKLYIACAGKDYVTPKVPGGIYVISASQNLLIDSLTMLPHDTQFDSLYPGRISIRGNEGYFISGYYGAIQKFDLSTFAVKDSIDGYFYNVAVNALDANDPNVYCTDATTLPGQFKIYDVSLHLIHDFTVGDFPSGIVFRNER